MWHYLWHRLGERKLASLMAVLRCRPRKLDGLAKNVTSIQEGQGTRDLTEKGKPGMNS